ncbi:MAG: hypothetical protein HY720_13585 [Planctomycetes bacterium]|nr:hypothetical protein [Planctomycetota bacterium]
MAVVGLLALSSPLLAQEIDGKTAASFEPFLGERTFATYSGDTKTGWFGIEIAAGREWNGKTVYALTHEFHGLPEGTGSRKETKYFDANPPFILIGFDLETDGEQGFERIEAAREGLTMVVHRKKALGEEKQDASISEETLAHYLTAQMACRESFEGNELRREIPEYSTNTLVDRRLELVVIKRPGLFDRGIPHLLYQAETIDTRDRGQPSTYTFFNELGEIVESRGQNEFYMRPEPAEWAQSATSYLHALGYSHLLVEGELPPGASPHRILVQIVDAEGPAPEATARQAVQELDAGNWVLVPRGVEWGDDAGDPAGGPEGDLLISGPEVETDLPAVQELARELAGEEDSAKGKAMAILRWIVKEIRPVRRSGPVGAGRVLAERSGDGPARAALFAAVARAAGLPARRVYGLVYQGGWAGYSEWVEVLEGASWKPVEPATGTLGLPGSHLRLGVLDEEGSARGSLALARARLRILPMGGVGGTADLARKVIVFRDSRAVLGRQLFSEGNRMYVRVEMGEVWWPTSEIAAVEDATPEKLAAIRHLVRDDGAYRNNVLGFSIQGAGEGWKAQIREEAAPDHGVVVQFVTPGDQGGVSFIVQASRVPLSLFADEVESSLRRQGAERTGEPDWFMVGEIYLQRRAYRIAGQGGAPARQVLLLFFEHGERKHYLFATGPEEAFGDVEAGVERILQGIRFDRP